MLPLYEKRTRACMNQAVGFRSELMFSVPLLSLQSFSLRRVQRKVAADFKLLPLLPTQRVEVFHYPQCSV